MSHFVDGFRHVARRLLVWWSFALRGCFLATENRRCPAPKGLTCGAFVPQPRTEKQTDDGPEKAAPYKDLKLSSCVHICLRLDITENVACDTLMRLQECFSQFIRHVVFDSWPFFHDCCRCGAAEQVSQFGLLRTDNQLSCPIGEPIFIVSIHFEEHELHPFLTDKPDALLVTYNQGSCTSVSELTSDMKHPQSETQRPYKEFGIWLKTILQQKGWEAGRLAKAIGTRPNTMSDYTSGKSRPSAFRVGYIAAILEVSPDELT